MSAPRWLRAPALHFVVLGGVLFVLGGGGENGAMVPPVTAPTVPATDADLLVDEALALGLDRRDPLVRARLAGLGRLADEGAVEDAPALEEAARRLGLERRDVVVRRHLAQVMALALAHTGPREWPTDADLAAYVARHRERFVQPARVRFTHVFFARDRAGEPAPVAAARVQAGLAARVGPVVPASLRGDAFLDGATVTLAGNAVARRFGTVFATRLATAPAEHWVGPIPSAYGLHVVWLHERTPERVPPLAAIRSRVVHAWLADRAAERLARRLAARRAQRERTS